MTPLSRDRSISQAAVEGICDLLADALKREDWPLAKQLREQAGQGIKQLIGTLHADDPLVRRLVQTRDELREVDDQIPAPWGAASPGAKFRNYLKAGQGSRADEPGRSADHLPIQSTRSSGPSPAMLRAAASYEWVCEIRPDLMPEDSKKRYTKAMWDHIKEHGCPAYEDEKVPGYETWKRQVRGGEASQRASSRAGRPHGKSIQEASQV